MQREILPFAPPVIEYILSKMPVHTVYDYDDALFIHKPSTHNKLASRLRSADKTRTIFSLVDCVVAGNDYLREAAAPYCENSVTLHVAEDTERFDTATAAHDDFNGVTIGWLGSVSTEKYLELIRGPLEQLASTHCHVRLKIIGGGQFKSEVIRIDHIPWALNTEAAELLSCDIGIMPLPDQEWSKGKSGGKARTYMAAGLPAVCTDIGYNKELIEHGNTGFLVHKPDEWLTALTNLVENKPMRLEVGERAKRYVRSNFSVNGIADELYHIISALKDGT